jgi:glucosyl-dolichyl phosphate glucuronosyltransferase
MLALTRHGPPRRVDRQPHPARVYEDSQCRVNGADARLESQRHPGGGLLAALLSVVIKSGGPVGADQGNQAAGEAAIPRPLASPNGSPVTVIVCAYTHKRWELTRAAIRSVVRQVPPPEQVLLVIDHNPALAARARNELTGITVLENDDAPGLSGARNTGLRAATQPYAAFLDDDAEARQGWLKSLTDPYADPKVVATGGHVEPVWPGFRPAWLSSTFYWVVGCSYTGLPDRVAPIRNPIGANMSMRTELALSVGGFDSSVGRVRGKARGCEETELSIRLTAARPGASVLYVPAAVVDHHVAEDRTRLSYFIRRCWNEGRSKATVVRLVGAAPGLERERRQVIAVIPVALLTDFRRLAAGELAALARQATVLSGLAATTAGYIVGRAGLPRKPAGMPSGSAASAPIGTVGPAAAELESRL